MIYIYKSSSESVMFFILLLRLLRRENAVTKVALCALALGSEAALISRTGLANVALEYNIIGLFFEARENTQWCVFAQREAHPGLYDTATHRKRSVLRCHVLSAVFEILDNTALEKHRFFLLQHF